jgi:2-methylcitrate dehydratase PrpD
VIRDLGVRYRIKELYFKPFACCRWVHPALEGVKEILEAHAISHREIDRVIVHTFREAAALSRKPPRCTEEAQYNLAFPIAAFLVFGRVGPVEVLERLEDPEVCRLMDRMVVQVDDELAEAFPEKALSRVEIIARDGTVYRSSTAQAAGDFDRPLSPEEKRN